MRPLSLLSLAQAIVVALKPSLSTRLAGHKGVELIRVLEILGHPLHPSTKQEPCGGVLLLDLLPGPLLLLDSLKIDGSKRKELK